MRTLVLAALLCGCYAQDPPTINLDGIGTITGSLKQSRSGRTIHSYQAIPFAESPTDALRFQVSRMDRNFIPDLCVHNS
jgi:hypothetical protein